ncbi:hypothetical protein WAI453_006641 [Rhynchosporium graminicola]
MGNEIGIVGGDRGRRRAPARWLAEQSSAAQRSAAQRRARILFIILGRLIETCRGERSAMLCATSMIDMLRRAWHWDTYLRHASLIEWIGSVPAWPSEGQLQLHQTGFEQV